jgi:hypothetical protein
MLVRARYQANEIGRKRLLVRLAGLPFITLVVDDVVEGPGNCGPLGGTADAKAAPVGRSAAPCAPRTLEAGVLLSLESHAGRWLAPARVPRRPGLRMQDRHERRASGPVPTFDGQPPGQHQGRTHPRGGQATWLPLVRLQAGQRSAIGRPRLHPGGSQCLTTLLSTSSVSVTRPCST